MGTVGGLPRGLLWASLLILVGASCASASNITEDEVQPAANCSDGLVIPLWYPYPQDGISMGATVGRAIVYFTAMVWMFIGVSIASDRFMGSIEMITSSEKEVTVKKPNGETQIIIVQVWNETVANLTLMALGSSAPEILLSVIEIIARDFESGDLGPGTIVGSAAFNLFVIISICVYVIPDGEVRYIKHLRVFCITSFFSVAAYVWMYIILAEISYGIVEFWEAFVTFLMFPFFVILAYIADRRLLFYKYISKEYRMGKRGVLIQVEGDDPEEHRKKDEGVKYDGDVDESVRAFEEHRKEYMSVIRELRAKYPDHNLATLEAMAREEITNRGPKSRAFYRMQATRNLTGTNKGTKNVVQEEVQEVVDDNVDKDLIRVFFEPGHYNVMECVGTFEVTVAREGGDLNQMVLVDYKTENGTANDGTDYVHSEGTIVFLPGETRKAFEVEILDDDVFEEDEHFYARLSNLRVGYLDGVSDNTPNHQPVRIELTVPFVCTIMIIDDDHGGCFNVDEKDVEIVETIGAYECKITRLSGARGIVMIPYYTEDGTGKAGKDYEHVEGELIFENQQTDQYVTIPILEEDSYEKDVLFYLVIGEPVSQGGFEFENKDNDAMSEDEKIALLGKPKLGPNPKAQIRIKENKEYKNMVDKLVKKANNSIVTGGSSWKDQFVEAFQVEVSEEDEEEEGEDNGEEKPPKQPSVGDYIMHCIVFIWKLLFALIPPTDYFYGYPTFVISILAVGGVTAFIGDIASHVGCTIGLKDSITAIAIVALGTSVPDTFASKVAAQQDPYADASVGNVTGSNAVNVFLGIGIAWTVAAIYHFFKGDEFEVQPGNLAFSVTLFCVEAAAAIFVMMLRRHPSIGGELGGPRIPKILTSAFLFFLWVFYVGMSTLEAYKIIPGMGTPPPKM